MKRNDGFTLIELLVTISAGALVSIAAASLLLLSTRVQHQTNREAGEQQQVRMILNLLETMAAGGELHAVRTTGQGWQLLKQSERAETPEEVVLEYVHAEQSLYRGEYDGNRGDNGVLLAGLAQASVAKEGNLLCIALETTGGASYTTRVYCRTDAVQDEANG